MKLISSIQSFYQSHPLRLILLVAIGIRLLAALFSEGYAFHDDHFCVTRVAQSWASGIPHWLESGIPPKHSMLYAGVNAALIWTAELLGFSDPYAKTTFLRLFHAFYSTLIVLLCFRITALISTNKNATIVGWITALLWFMPFMSVRFLVEMVCIPPVLAGFYYLLKASNRQNNLFILYALAGALFGIAFAIRYHTILFAGGLGLVLLYRKEWQGAITFTIGYLAAAFISVGLIDIIFFDYPFHSIVEYFGFNSANANNFVSGSPFKFTLTTFGFLIPPVSVFLMIGYIRAAKLEPMMFVAVLVFFVFHSSFPNQQERFILPIFPMMIILGVIGWNMLTERSNFWNQKGLASKISWWFFWTLNVSVALFMAFTFTKKDRIAPLHYLSQQKDVSSVIIENEKSVKQPPVYYGGDALVDYNEIDEEILGVTKQEVIDHYNVVFRFGKKKSGEELMSEMNELNKDPNYIIFQGTNDLQERINRVTVLFDDAEWVKVNEIRPSMLDRILHAMNPRVHRDQTAIIFKRKN